MIEVVCPCGEAHKTPEKNAGRSFNCPKCGVGLRFPQPNQPFPTAPLPPTSSAPPPLPKQTDWFYAAGSVQKGPHSLAEIQELFATGTINRQTSVWRDGMQTWLPLGDTEVVPAVATPTVLAEATANTAGQSMALYLGVFVGTVTIDAIISPSVVGVSEALFGEVGYSFGYAAALAISVSLSVLIVSGAIAGLSAKIRPPVQSPPQQSWNFLRSVEERIGWDKYKWRIIIGLIVGLMVFFPALAVTISILKSLTP